MQERPLSTDSSAEAPAIPDKRIAVVTDAWAPQVNGVVRTYENMRDNLERLGYETRFINPGAFTTVPCPTYPDIRLALFPRKRIERELDDFRPGAVHVATEGPLGHAARAVCQARGVAFTTSFHTQFPEYIRLRAPVPLDWSYAYVRRFHSAAQRTLVPTPSQRERLQDRGFENVVIWSRGVNTSIFHPYDGEDLDLPRPVFVYMGRVAVEKNIEAFLNAGLPGSKVVIGGGPDLEKLKREHPSIRFLGFKFGEELARSLAACDVFVFPSLTDTFGVVLLEAMACGVPVAAYPVTGPIDVVRHGVTGILDEDLATAAIRALDLDPGTCIDYARGFSWESSAKTFASHLEPVSAWH